MASRIRTIDPEIWQKPEFMRATPVARELWLGLITSCADDEGRFENDSWAITQRLFPRSHPATEESVSDGLRYWCECGWVLFYGGEEEEQPGRYGFLTGWFEHQYIRDRQPSSLPQPQVLIGSWRDVDIIKEWYVFERGGKANSHFRTIIREYVQSLQRDNKLSMKRLRRKYALSSQRVNMEGKGREGKLESKKTPPTPPVPGGATGSSLDGHGRRQRRQPADDLTPLERQALAGLKRDNQVATIEQVREFSALWMEYPDPDDPPLQFTDWHKQFRVWAKDPNDRQFALDLRDLYELRERVKNRG